MGQLVHLADAAAGRVSEVAICELSETLVMTAVRNSNGLLELIAWSVSADAAGTQVGGQHIKRKGSTVGAAASLVSVTNVIPLIAANVFTVATAVQDANSSLRIDIWQVAADASTIKRIGGTTVGTVSEIALVSINQGLVVTAVRGGNNNLQLIAWTIQPAGQIRQGASASAGAASRIAALTLGAQTCVTQLQNGSGDLELISWSVALNGGEITRRASAAAGAISEGAIAFLTKDESAAGIYTDQVVSAVRNGSNLLELIDWSMPDTSAPTITRVQSVTGAALSGIDCEYMPDIDGTSLVVTAGLDGSNRLRLDAWGFTGPQQPPSDVATLSGEVLQQVKLSSVAGSIVVAAARDADSNLTLSSYSLSL